MMKNLYELTANISSGWVSVYYKELFSLFIFFTYLQFSSVSSWNIIYNVSWLKKPSVTSIEVCAPGIVVIMIFSHKTGSEIFMLQSNAIKYY